MKGIGQLFKGILIGLVLLLAVIGLLKISGKTENPDLPTPTQSNIPTPSISVNSPSSTTNTPSDSTASSTIEDTPLDSDAENHANEEQLASKTEPNTPEKTVTDTQESFKPEILEEPISYGTLNLSAKQKVEFLIFNEKNKRVAASKNNHKASFHLPVGEYKVVTLLGNKKETQTVRIEKDKISNTDVSIQAPITTGVLKVAAVLAKSKQSIKTTFSIEDTNGELVGKRLDVASTLFKLDAGTYKITATYDGMSETRSVNITAGTSSQEIFNLKKSSLPSEEIVKTIEEDTNQPVELVKEPVATPIETPVVSAPAAIDPIVTPNTTTTASTTTEEEPQNSTPPTPKEPLISEVVEQGTLKLSSISSNTKKPVKSNFYVQTTNGKHIAKKIYTDSANFTLEKGTYRITIKSKNMKTITKTMTVDTNSKFNQIFSMQGIMTATAPQAVTSETDFVPINVPAKSPNPARPPAFGSLIFDIRQNSNNVKAPLLSNFIIKTKSGKKIAQINKVQHATVKLDVGEYVITANHRGRRKSRSFKINNNRATKISFKSSEFSAFTPQAPVRLKKGILRSRVINNQGRPIKGNISVTNAQGKIIHRANNVSTAEFRLPAKPYTVHINYQGLKGSERVRIIPGETTVQTFTIADAPAPQTRQQHNSRNTQRQNMSGRELRNAIEDKVKEELRRITR